MDIFEKPEKGIISGIFKRTGQRVKIDCPKCKKEENIKVLRDVGFPKKNEVLLVIKCECGAVMIANYKRTNVPFVSVDPLWKLKGSKKC